MNEWNPEQKQYLKDFYKDVTDPDAKVSMLNEATGGGSFTFHATHFDTQGNLNSISDSQLLIASKIACFEYQLLEQVELLKPEYY